MTCMYFFPFFTTEDTPVDVSVAGMESQSNLKGSSEATAVLTRQPFFQQLRCSEQEDLKAMLDDDERKIKRLFGMLVITTCDSVEERIPVANFAKHILALGAYDPAPEERDRSLLNEHRHEIKGAKSISEIFDILHAYWDYLNYEILEYIINLYGTSEDTERLRKYNEELHNFCKRRLFEVPMPVSDSGIGNEKRQEELCVLLNVREDIRVEEFYRIKRKIAKILHVRLFSLFIQSVDGGIAQLQKSEGQP